jgi:hypothetical protein
MKIVKILFGCFLIALGSCSTINNSATTREHRDFVPDEETAIKIAEAIWLPIFGERIYENRPFEARLEKGVWIVEGTLPPEYALGGTPYIEIQKYDCKVLLVTHGK